MREPVLPVVGLLMAIDSGHLLYARDGKEGSRVWRVNIKTGKAEDTGIGASGLRHLRVHPDGHRIAFAVANSGFEIWAMDGLLKRP